VIHISNVNAKQQSWWFLLDFKPISVRSFLFCSPCAYQPPVNPLNRFLEACPEKKLQVKPEYLDLSSHPNHVHRRRAGKGWQTTWGCFRILEAVGYLICGMETSFRQTVRARNLFLPVSYILTHTLSSHIFVAGSLPVLTCACAVWPRTNLILNPTNLASILPIQCFLFMPWTIRESSLWSVAEKKNWSPRPYSSANRLGAQFIGLVVAAT